MQRKPATWRYPRRASSFAESHGYGRRGSAWNSDKCETHARTHSAPHIRKQRHPKPYMPPHTGGRAKLFLPPSRSYARKIEKVLNFFDISESAATWLILPVVICLSQRLSHACLSISIVQRNCRRLIKTVMVYLMVHCYLDNRSNSRANTCTKGRLTKPCIY